MHVLSCSLHVLFFLSENRTQHSLSLKLNVQIQEKAQKVPVRIDCTSQNNRLDGSAESKTLTQHKVR